ncbi:MAG: hypothetical protein HQ517_00600 [SAR324 cluster bacterium]|nr:hypothetical protein [SAR324 cluster bacterium]
MILSELNPNIFKLVQCESTAGGGSLPGRAIPSWGVSINIAGFSENQLLDQLRASDPPVICRIHEGSVILDCRTVLPHQILLLKNVLQSLQML